MANDIENSAFWSSHPMFKSTKTEYNVSEIGSSFTVKCMVQIQQIPMRIQQMLNTNLS
jgi:hypothetical protein